MTRDIHTGHVRWRGYGVVNPFTDEGPLVDLKEFPKLAAYLEAHKPAITRRHVAKRDERRWYRTIDRITPALASRPKLLIPDIKEMLKSFTRKGSFIRTTTCTTWFRTNGS